jgi:hypothetical protein
MRVYAANMTVEGHIACVPDCSVVERDRVAVNLMKATAHEMQYSSDTSGYH